jgi:transcriptional regulator with XRE-family HTH domain
MTKREFDSLLAELGLSQAEAARLLSVDARTVRRWAEDPVEIPGPAEQALRAWLALHRFGLPWAPDSVDLVQHDPEQIAKHRAHAIDLDALLRKVEKRGGPAAPWQVDIDQCRATLGPLQVSFYRLRNGGFSPQSYRRKDGPADLQRDWPLIEDAFAHIAQAIARQRQKEKLK